jgi:16S rRNA processing protein RimM
MKNIDDYYYLGVITKLHGNNGQVNAFLDVDEPMEYSMLDMVFLNINDTPVPFFIKKINIKNNKAVITFEDIEDNEKASQLIKKEMYLPLSTLPKLTGNNFYYHEIEGYTVIDKNFGKLGLLENILDYPNQAVMQITHKNKEVLVPVNDDIIIDVNREKKTLTIDAPDGLIDIYLNP